MQKKIQYILQSGPYAAGFISAACLLALLSFYCAVIVNKIYYERWPLQGDTASYWLRDIETYEKVLGKPYKISILREALKNPRDPLRTAALGFVSPKKALSINGHLYFSCFAAFLFFLNLSASIWFRHRSYAYALVGPILFFFAGGVFHPLYGLPSKLPDMPAALIFGAAQFALYSGIIRKSPRWFCVSGILWGVATLARYHVWIYGAFILGPIALAYTARALIYEKQTSISKSFLPLFCFCCGFTLVAGWFVWGELISTFTFYTSAGYAINSTVGEAFSTTGKKFFTNLVELPGLTVWFAVLSAFIGIQWRGKQNIDRFDFFIKAWGATACLMLVLAVMRVQDDYTQTFYALPGVLFFFLAPFRNKNGTPFCASAISRFSKALTCVLPLLFIWGFQFHVESDNFRYPPSYSTALNVFNKDLADLIAFNIGDLKTNRRLPVIDCNFQYYARYMIPQILEQYKKLSKFGNVFQIRQSQWRLTYGENEEEAKKQIVALLTNNIDVFAALTEFSNKSAETMFKDEYTTSLAQYVNGILKNQDDVWENRGHVDGPMGRVTVYKNRYRHKLFTDGIDALRAVEKIVDATQMDSSQRGILYSFLLPDQVLTFLNADLKRTMDIRSIIAESKEPDSAEKRTKIILNHFYGEGGCFVVLEDAAPNSARLVLSDDLSRYVSRRMREQLAADSERWMYLATIGSPWGNLIVFKSRA